MDRVRELAQLSGSDLNAAKQLLADEATALLHGTACLPGIHATAQSLFAGEGQAFFDSLPKLQLTAQDMPTNSSISILAVIVKAQLAKSKGEASRLIKAGGVRINDVKVDCPTRSVSGTCFGQKDWLKLSVGKKHHVILLRPV